MRLKPKIVFAAVTKQPNIARQPIANVNQGLKQKQNKTIDKDVIIV